MKYSKRTSKTLIRGRTIRVVADTQLREAKKFVAIWFERTKSINKDGSIASGHNIESVLNEILDIIYIETNHVKDDDDDDDDDDDNEDERDDTHDDSNIKQTGTRESTWIPKNGWECFLLYGPPAKHLFDLEPSQLLTADAKSLDLSAKEFGGRKKQRANTQAENQITRTLSDDRGIPSLAQQSLQINYREMMIVELNQLVNTNQKRFDNSKIMYDMTIDEITKKKYKDVMVDAMERLEEYNASLQQLHKTPTTVMSFHTEAPLSVSTPNVGGRGKKRIRGECISSALNTPSVFQTSISSRTTSSIDDDSLDGSSCCCGCPLNVSQSHHFCSKTGRRVGAWCYFNNEEEGFGSKALCRRCAV